MIDIKGNTKLFEKLQIASSQLGIEIGACGFRPRRGLQSSRTATLSKPKT
jgi:hypothetical protein